MFYLLLAFWAVLGFSLMFLCDREFRQSVYTTGGIIAAGLFIFTSPLWIFFWFVDPDFPSDIIKLATVLKLHWVYGFFLACFMLDELTAEVQKRAAAQGWTAYALGQLRTPTATTAITLSALGGPGAYFAGAPLAGIVLVAVVPLVYGLTCERTE